MPSRTPLPLAERKQLGFLKVDTASQEWAITRTAAFPRPRARGIPHPGWPVSGQLSNFCSLLTSLFSEFAHNFWVTKQT